VKFKGTIENKSMGGIGIIADSIHLNLQNPASYSRLKLTTFSLAGTYSDTGLKTSKTSESATRNTLDYLAVSFPSGNFGFTFGLMPFTSVGYQVEKIGGAGEKSFRYNGDGGLNRIFVGGGYQISPKLSLGIDLGYNFGQIETNSTVAFPNVQYASRELNNSALSGLNINTGLIYQAKFKKYDVYSSISFAPSTSITSVNSRSIATVTYNSTGVEVINQSQTINVANNTIKLPSKFSFGAGLGMARKWFVGFESTFQQSNNFGNRYNDITNVSFEDGSKIAVGGFYIPNYASFNNYFDKITYRAGLRYENTGLIINAKSINDTALTLGVGLPILGGYFSNANLGFEFGKRGTTDANLIQENYINFSIGLSFNDKWFTKRKYD
jgi:long-subunit fatty acid transport protein